MGKKRNIVLIVSDQMRSDFIGPYGADFIRTPNLNALAENGMTFDNAITASTVCAPARASMLTGKFVSGHDGWTNEVPCKEGSVYLAERLNDQGYMTAAVGFSDHVTKERPLGYQYQNTLCDTDRPLYKTYWEWLKDKYPDAKSYGEDDGTRHFKYPEEDFYDRWGCDRATDFIDSYVKKGCAPDGTAPKEADAPFFLYCGFLSPHDPLVPPHGLEDAVDESRIPPIFNSTRQDVGEVEQYRRAWLNPHEALVDPEGAVPERMKKRKSYCELIAEVDTLIGRIVQSLKDNGVYENTTIIFTCDHGSVDNDYNMLTKGPWPYRSQLFIPMIISNDPAVTPGTRSDCLCGNLDVGATILSIAKDERAFGVSRSMIGMANGTVPQRRVNMSEFCDTSKTIVDKQYTYIYYPFTGEACLYDRINDPTEMTNLSGRPEYAEVERKFLMDAVDFMCLSKGIRIEAHDLVPKAKAGLEEKHPKFWDDFDIAYPLGSWGLVKRVKEAGLDYNYNEFCRDREIVADYGVYFHKEKPEDF